MASLFFRRLCWLIVTQVDQPFRSPGDQEVRRLAEELINQQSTMTLATARESVAWAAPVYYVLFRSVFYFFSDPKSRHILESMEGEQVSAAIYPSVTGWREIRGIQMSGLIQQMSPGLEAIQAIRAYLKKFPFTKEFFDSHQPLNLENFGKRFRVKLYKFSPALVFYLDNRIRFGFRAETKL